MKTVKFLIESEFLKESSFVNLPFSGKVPKDLESCRIPFYEIYNKLKSKPAYRVLQCFPMQNSWDVWLRIVAYSGGDLVKWKKKFKKLALYDPNLISELELIKAIEIQDPADALVTKILKKVSWPIAPKIKNTDFILRFTEEEYFDAIQRYKEDYTKNNCKNITHQEAVSLVCHELFKISPDWILPKKSQCSQGGFFVDLALDNKIFRITFPLPFTRYGKSILDMGDVTVQLLSKKTYKTKFSNQHFIYFSMYSYHYCIRELIGEYRGNGIDSHMKSLRIKFIEPMLLHCQKPTSISKIKNLIFDFRNQHIDKPMNEVFAMLNVNWSFGTESVQKREFTQEKRDLHYVFFQKQLIGIPLSFISFLYYKNGFSKIKYDDKIEKEKLALEGIDFYERALAAGEYS